MAMKKIFKSLFVMAAASATIIACNKEVPAQIDEIGEELVEVTIIAGNPITESSTKTELVGLTPYWSVNDAIGVTDGSADKNYKFTTDITARAATASFTGTTSVSSTLYAYYPYQSNGVSATNGAKVDIPLTQHPTAASFDGAADIMVAKSFTVNPANTTVEDLEFMRLGAIVKLVLKDKYGTMTGTQHPRNVSLTAESNLVGRVYIDLVNQSLGELYYNGSGVVTAEYSTATQYELNGTNATYFVVYPQTITEGTTLTVAAETENYEISKDITVPPGGIVLEAGKITTLNVSLLASHINAASAGAALPFNDDMAWADNGTTDDGTDLVTTISTASSGLYVSASKAYKGKGGLKLGTGSAIGSVTTKELDLSGAFYISIEAGKYGSDTGNLVVSIDGDEAVISTNDFSDVLYANVAAGTYSNKSKVTIATSTKRAYVYSVNIISGSHAVPPVINVTSSNPMAVANTNDLYAIEYTIDNPTSASISASANVAWIHDFDYSVDGEVSFEVDAQADGDPERSGIITLSYTDASDVTVTVNQAAGSGVSITEGANWSYTFEEKVWDAAGEQTLNGKTWTMAGTGDGYWGYDATKGQQFGSGNKPYTALTLTSNFGASYGVREIRVSTSGASSINATVSVSVGGTSFECSESTTAILTATNTVYTFVTPDGNLKAGDIVISYANSSAKAVYIKKIVVNPAAATQLTMSDITCTAHTSSSLTFGWSAVTDAIGYQVSTDGSTFGATQSGLSYTLTGLDAETDYYIWVKAIGDGVDTTTSEAKKSAVGTTDASSGGTPTLQYTLDGGTTATGNAYATASTLTQNGIGWSVMGNTEMSPWRIGGKSITNQDRAIYSTTAISANISSIEVESGATASSLTVNSLKITVHNSASDAASGSNAIATKTVTSGIASSTVTFDKEDNTSWAGKYYRIVYNVTRSSSSGNGYITFVSAKFYGI